MINYVSRKPELPWSSLGENSTEKFYGSKLTINTKMHEGINHGEWKRFWYRIYQKLALSIQITDF